MKGKALSHENLIQARIWSYFNIPNPVTFLQISVQYLSKPLAQQ